MGVLLLQFAKFIAIFPLVANISTINKLHTLAIFQGPEIALTNSELSGGPQFLLLNCASVSLTKRFRAIFLTVFQTFKVDTLKASACRPRINIPQQYRIFDLSFIASS